jgi:hypothetical protein
MAAVHSSFWGGVEAWSGAFNNMGTATGYTSSAVSEGRWGDAGRGAQSLGQMGGTLAQVPSKVAARMIVGAFALPVRIPKDAWDFGTAARQCYAGDRGGWDLVWHGTMLAGDVYATYGLYRAYTAGQEIEVSENLRIAPLGNRTGHPTGELPHYHLRGTKLPSGETAPGQGIGRHRPWDVGPVDTSFFDRIFDTRILPSIFGADP